MSRFTDALDLRLLEDPPGHPVLSPSGRSMWLVIEPLVWEVGTVGSGVTITVPEGSQTDLASIPRAAWDILPPDGPWAKAAVLHDALYKNRGDVPRTGHPAPFTREEADQVLDDAMAALGVAEADRVIIYEAVRLGGEQGWGS